MYKLGIVGFGAIARAQHVPCIAANARFELAAILGHANRVNSDIPVHATLVSLLENVDAVVLCTPPDPRFEIALRVIDAGKPLLLEKPPTTTFGAGMRLVSAAAAAGVTLFATWHSQYNRAVDVARDILTTDPPAHIDVTWSEDVAVHHPGQDWIWQAGGFGVFDAGINALSILTRILPDALLVTGGRLMLGPGEQTPIRAEIMATCGEGEAHLIFDWQVSTDRREISIRTRSGRILHMPASGRHLLVDGAVVVEEGRMEYPRMYEHFARLLDSKSSEADLEPLRIVTDALAVLSREPMARRG